MDSPKEVLIGRLAVERGMISEEELVQALEAQASMGGIPIGELLVQLSLLNRQQLSDLVAIQKENLSAPSPYSQGKEVAADLLGKHAVEQGLITPEQLKETIREQGVLARRGQALRLGELLIDKGYLTVEQVEQLLGKQGKRLMRCTACGTQFNVHAGVQSPACKKCGGELAESASVPGARKAKSEGSYYALKAMGKDTTPSGKGAAAKNVRYLDYQKRVKGNRPWWRRWQVHAALGTSVLAILLVILVSPEPAPKKKPPVEPPEETEKAETSLKPSADDLEAWLAAHAQDPVACAKRLREESDRVFGTGDEARIAALLQKYEEPVMALGEGAYESVTAKSRSLERQEQYGAAYMALADLPADKDPLGEWNRLLAREREGVVTRVSLAWQKIMADAMAWAKQGKWDEAIRVAEKGKTLGFAQLNEETDKVIAQLKQRIAQAPPAQPPIKPPAPPAPTPPDESAVPPDEAAGTFEEVLAFLRDGLPHEDPVACHLCAELRPRTAPCLPCRGMKRVGCPACKGEGKIACTGPLHKQSTEAQSGIPDVDVGKWEADWQQHCKMCDDKKEFPCKACGGKKTLACVACRGKGTEEWICPLSGGQSTVHAMGKDGACWLCKGAGAAACGLCRGAGRLPDVSCAACAGMRQLVCATCTGLASVSCDKCKGTGYLKSTTPHTSTTDPSTGPYDADPVNQARIPGKQTCDRCDAKGKVACKECRDGAVPCAACKEAKGPECWACAGKGKPAACPVCAGGSVWWAKTSGGAHAFLCELADLSPLADAGLRAFVGLKEAEEGGSRFPIAWTVLVVDNRRGDAPSTWMGSPELLRCGDRAFLPSASVRGPDASGWHLESLAPLLGVSKGTLSGASVAPGQASLFLLAHRPGAALSEDAALLDRDGASVAKLHRAPLDAALRQSVLRRYWTRGCGQR